jgi:hypothetical protein
MMAKHRKIAVIYYSLACALDIILCVCLVVLLNWPLLAKGPLAAFLFIEILYVSKVLFNGYVVKHEGALSRILLKIKEFIYNVEA